MKDKCSNDGLKEEELENDIIINNRQKTAAMKRSYAVNENLNEYIYNRNRKDEEVSDSINMILSVLISIMKVLIRTGYRIEEKSLLEQILKTDFISQYHGVCADHAEYRSEGDDEHYQNIMDNLITRGLEIEEVIKENPEYQEYTPTEDCVYWGVRENKRGNE